MREILFRGKRMNNGEWAEGYLYEHEPALVGIVSENDVPESSKWFIARTGFADWNMPRPVEFVEVDPSTVGQYTGLTDKNGKRIFEWDIMKQKDITYQDEIQIEGEKYLVTSSSGCWFGICKKPDCKRAIFLSELCNTGEVIGNIHDNPELLDK